MEAYETVSISIAYAATVAALAYSVPKLYWYRAQSQLLAKHAAGEQKLLDIHIADRTTDVDEFQMTDGLGNKSTFEGQYL
jgi:hypothetical protein